jgi:hypothetical protein
MVRYIKIIYERAYLLTSQVAGGFVIAHKSISRKHLVVDVSDVKSGDSVSSSSNLSSIGFILTYISRRGWTHDPELPWKTSTQSWELWSMVVRSGANAMSWKATVTR